MNDLLAKIKRIAKNKNTVTIVGVILILGLLYWGYSSQVNTSVSPVTVPVAAETIQPRTQITADMVSDMSVPSIAVVDNVYTSKNAIINMYSNVNTIIPKGSMFYREALVSKSELPDSAFFDISEDEIPYMFNVTLESTYGNSIYPGSKIDIYMKAADEEGKVMFGKLLSDVLVISVKDSSGNDVFENTEDSREPAYLIFGLKDKYHLLLRKASYLDVELIPVPHGGKIVSDDKVTTVASTVLEEYITSKTIVLPGQEGTTTEESTKTETKTETKK